MIYRTRVGGDMGAGTVFRMDAAGETMILHSFGGASGATLRASLVQGRDGAFYGPTEDGGRYGGGVVFRISLPSTPHHDSRDN